MRMRLGLLCTALATAGMGTALGDEWGTQSSQGQSGVNRQGSPSSGQQSQSSWGQQGSQSGQSSGSQQQMFQPDSWVAVAYDFDNDGQYDAFEYITSYDLEDVRSRAQRNQQMGQGGEQLRTTGDQGSQQKMKQLSGTIESLYTKSKRGERCLIAEIQTDQGQTVTADLGSPQHFNNVNLQEGDYIRLSGMKVRMGGQQILMAKRVNVQGQSFAVNQHQHGRMQPQRQGESGQQQRYSGDVLSTRTAKFRNTDQPCLIAYVELENGKVETVNFGPKHDVKDCVQEGETITFSARHGRVNGRPALIAQRVETQQGQMTQIDWSGSRSSRSPQRSFQQDRMESTGWGQSSSTDWQSSSY